ncbi:MAG TPA: enoyl-CoA hydratase/isomerase family protein [Candidatus Dormibacteraeota bacterium]|nr:enoyl-CoA hydratase/isomerase family protein [Candidatus Dormibacteraeota bacterium]
MTRIDLDSRYLDATLDDGVMRVVINRPERRNACTIEMYHGIKKAAVLADRDPAVDVLLLTGTGDVFCVGGEMGGKHEGGGALDRETDGLDLLPFRALETTRAIVVTAINGLCQGGGLNMALCSDIAIASDRATFRAPELLRGVSDPFLPARLPARVGTALAKYLLFTAAVIDAREAERIGLVARVVAHEELPAAVDEVLAQVRNTGPAARAALKHEINRHLPEFDMVMFAQSIRGPEVAEGFQAFVEKRPPRWPRG